MSDEMRDALASLSNIYAHLAHLADERGDKALSDELMRKSFRLDMMSNA